MEVTNSTSLLDQFPVSIGYVASTNDLTSKSHLQTTMNNINVAIILGITGILLDKINSSYVYDDVLESYVQVYHGFEEIVKNVEPNDRYKLDLNSLHVLLSASNYTIQISQGYNESNKLLEDLCKNQKCFDVINHISHTFVPNYLNEAYKRSAGSLSQVIKASRQIETLITSSMVAVFANSLLFDKDYPFQKLSDKLEPFLVNSNKHIIETINRCETQLLNNVKVEILKVIKQNSEASEEAINKVLIKSLAIKYDWYDFECMVNQNFKDDKLSFLDGSHVNVCGDKHCGTCFLRPNLDGQGLLSLNRKRDAAKWIQENLTKEVQKLGQVISEGDGTKPDYFQKCDFDSHVKYFNKDMDVWDLKDANCVGEIIEEAMKNYMLNIKSIGCWSSQFDVHLYFTSKREAFSRLCMQDTDKSFTACLFLEDPDSFKNTTMTSVKLPSIEEVESLFDEKTDRCEGMKCATNKILAAFGVITGLAVGTVAAATGASCLKSKVMKQQPGEKASFFDDGVGKSTYQALADKVKDSGKDSAKDKITDSIMGKVKGMFSKDKKEDTDKLDIVVVDEDDEDENGEKLKVADEEQNVTYGTLNETNTDEERTGTLRRDDAAQPTMTLLDLVEAVQEQEDKIDS